MTQYPPLPVFDEDDIQVGEAMLEEILAKSLLHRVIHVMVEDEKSNVLLQLRSKHVRTDPNSWDFSVGGYVDAGENYRQAAERELKEELGIEDFEIEDLGTIREKLQSTGYDINRFSGEFKVLIPSTTHFKLEESEVAKVQWFSKDELRQLIDEKPPELTEYFRDRLKEYYFGDENN